MLPFVTFSRNVIMDLLGIDDQKVDTRSPLGRAIRPSPMDFITRTPRLRSTSSTPKRNKDSRVILMAINENIIDKIQATFINRQSTTPEKQRAHHVLSATARSNITRILNADFSNKGNRVEPGVFTAWGRSQLGLAPVAYWGPPRIFEGWDDALEACARTHTDKAGTPTQVAIDPYGDHAAGCLSSNAAYYGLHSGLLRTFHKFAEEAGFTGLGKEPPSNEVLNRRFTKSQLQGMFPKNATVHEMDLARAIRTHLLEELPPESSEFQHQVKEGAIRYMQNQLDQSMAERRVEKKSVRLDLHIVDPIDGTHIYVDVTTVHASATTKLTQSLAFMTNNARADRAARAKGPSNAFKGTSSTCVTKARTDKHRKYQHFLSVAALLFRKGQLGTKKMPIFLAPVFAHHGELGGDAFILIERLCTAVFKRAASLPPRDDDLSPKAISADFRKRLKDALAAAVIRGYGAILFTAGSPY